MAINYNERTGEFEEDSSQKSKDKISNPNSQNSESESLSERIMWQIVKFVALIVLCCVFAYFDYKGESFWGSVDFYIGIITGVILWLIFKFT